MKRWGLTLVVAVILIVSSFIYFLQKSQKDLYAYIPNADEGSISVINTTDDKVVKKIKVDSQLSDGIEASLDGKFIFAGNYSKGELFVINAKTGQIEKKYRLEKTFME